MCITKRSRFAREAARTIPGPARIRGGSCAAAHGRGYEIGWAISTPLATHCVCAVLGYAVPACLLASALLPIISYGRTRTIL